MLYSVMMQHNLRHDDGISVPVTVTVHASVASPLGCISSFKFEGLSSAIVGCY